ncbi:cyclase [Streptoalloteichus tenebrarius]|uniref:Cyclase n=1 Tax=Streptoalloteichus tenebrarius (strain ATCC 17920 / DSM 40477 / JCM 4838 / CBS 697.72 / NBRC 16177 / NCIMB 11028 / NRRL B-12390 / A12253. 1 / ISP 5477) TaxID=1933 RepID=A0ABT1HM41_STRSD|nr:MBL fold metallo-hydrolase [Streptoalloteichus tenebrarius]MCP2256589.1 cyclase [Streptoalloteichus tenebrarius]BFF04942.1 MBL fold metallo-hydrolase [Streptoalloteichus tenebrarius]
MSAQPHVNNLSARVAAYVQPDGGWFLNNAGWITGAERTVLVDTCATESRTRRLLDALSAHSSSPHVPLTAALTHSHGDHANGARLITESGGTVLVTETAAKEIANGPHTYPQVFACESWGDITPPENTTAITDATRVDLGGGNTVEVIPVARPAHTHGDLVVWHPHDGVLFVGDLLSHGVVPLALHGSVAGWLSTLDWIDEVGARWLVPGHGPVASARDGLVTRVADYLRWLLDTASTLDDPADPEPERRARARWADWLDPERHAVNLRVAHAEVHGYPVDVPAALAAMLTAAGGQITLDL